MIMVDELRAWPAKVGGAAGRIFGSGRASCHLTTDEGVDVLHAFASKIGLKRGWFQDHPIAPHYDLTPKRRELALAAGAIEMSALQQARRRRATKRA